MSPADASYHTDVSQPQPNKRKGWKRFSKRLGVAASIATVVSLPIGAWTVFNPNRNVSDEGPRSQITIDSPRDTIALCDTVHGRFRNAKGRTLMFAYQFEGSEQIFLRQPETIGGKEFSMKDNFGTLTLNNHKVKLMAFFVSQAEAQFIQGINSKGNDGRPGYYSTKGLPPTAEEIVETQVTRTGPGTQQCSS